MLTQYLLGGGFRKGIGGYLGGDGGVQSITIRPAAGRIWIVHWLNTYHDDNGGVRLLEWFYDDNVIATVYKLRTFSTIANAVRLPLYYQGEQMTPFVLEYGTNNLIVQATGVLAGKNFMYEGEVTELIGNLERQH